MLRLVDVKAALEARGYRSGVSAEVHLDIQDDLFPENSGKKRLVISDGGAEVTGGGDGRIRLDVRGLAALYTGHLSAHDLAVTSLIDASDGDLESLGAVFAGPAPWMADMF